MDPIIFQFLLGAVGGVGAALVTSRRSKRTRAGLKGRRRSPPNLQRRTREPRTKTMRTVGEPNTLALNNETLEQQSAISPARPQAPASPSSDSERGNRETPVDKAVTLPQKSNLSTCPSCGLEGSHSLLSEHFQSSPSHPYGKQVTPSKEPDISDDAKQESASEDHHTGLIRNLLSVLVPPRAFGRRHLQPAESPFASVTNSAALRSASTRSLRQMMLSIDN